MSPTNPRALITYSATALVVIVLGSYTYFQAADYISGPRLSISSPTHGESVSKKLVRIHGTAENISFLSLNGRQIYTDTNGKFTEPLLLQYGYNIITLTAEGRFGRSETETVHVVAR